LLERGRLNLLGENSTSTSQEGRERLARETSRMEAPTP
jgi:hypothetical protein